MKIIKKVIFFFTLFSLLTLSLYVFKFIGYSFSLAFFFMAILIILSLKHTPINSWKIYFLLLFHQFLVLVLFIMDLDFLEFIKSFLLVNIALIGIIVSKFHVPSVIHKINYTKILSIAVCAIVLFEIIQVLEYNFIGTSFTWFFLDNYSISTAENVGRFQAANFLNYMRPVSFYHEPSYLGLVLLTILIWVGYVKVKLYVKLLIVIGLILSLSTTIYFFTFLYFVPKLYNLKYSKFLFLFLFLLLLYNFSDLEVLRFNEIVNEGTSGYARIGMPFLQVIDIIFNQNNFFGIPFGQSSIIFDNSFFVIFSYYGILTPIFYFLIFGSLFRSINERIKLYNYFLIIGACLFVNGAFFTPETSFLIVFTNYFLINNLTFNKVKI